MIIAVNVALRDTLKETLEEIAQRLGQAKKYAAIGTPYAVRVFGPHWAREKDRPVLQYRLTNGLENRETAWKKLPVRIFLSGQKREVRQRG